MASGRFKLPEPDNRRNEWSPMPSGMIVAAFVAPVALIMFWGAIIETNEATTWVFAIVAIVFTLWAAIAACDAAYIAGMRRVADQDLQLKDLE